MKRSGEQSKLIPLKHGVVWVHPNPEGIVHFVGGYFFGTGVSCWYKSLLDRFKQRFTVHAYSYSFAELSHWRIASELLEQIEAVTVEGIRTAKQSGFSTAVYSDPNYHCLVGHSLGCECIALIRLLGIQKEDQLKLLDSARTKLGDRAVTHQDFTDVETLPQWQPVPYRASLLMAPCFLTPTAVSWLLKVRPQQALVQYLIEQKPELLPLTSLISFEGDTIAGPDVEFTHQTLSQQGNLLDYHQLKIDHPKWTALQYHMTPAFDPIDSGLSECAADYIAKLVNISPDSPKKAITLLQL